MPVFRIPEELVFVLEAQMAANAEDAEWNVFDDIEWEMAVKNAIKNMLIAVAHQRPSSVNGELRRKNKP